MSFFAAVALTGAGTAIGLCCSLRLKRRKQTLEQAVLLAEEMQIKIGYQALPIKEIIGQAVNNKAYDRLRFLKKISECAEEYNFHSAWENGISSAESFTAEDKAILLALGEGLGASGCDGQLSLLETHKTLLERQLTAADDEYSRKGKMVRSVGMLCGLAAGISVL